MLTFRPRYDEDDQKLHGELAAIDFSNDPGKTIQEPTEDADINVLMRRMGVKDGSALPHFPDPKALYGDFSLMSTDPVELADALYQGQLAFMRLPAALRQRYGSPEALFTFMNDNDNYDEAVKLGLLEKKATPPEVVSPSTSSVKEKLVPEPRGYARLDEPETK